MPNLNFRFALSEAQLEGGLLEAVLASLLAARVHHLRHLGLDGLVRLRMILFARFNSIISR